MTDVLIMFGKDARPQEGELCLRDRPGLENLPIEEIGLSWGKVLIQRARCEKYSMECRGGRSIITVGRPTIRGGQLQDSPGAFARWVFDRVGDDSLADHASSISESLSGMYVLCEITESSVCLLTDHMGFRPVYVSRSSEGGVLGFGTHVESLAAATSQLDQVDLVSIGELFAHNYITFPYTTRRTIHELDPCSLHRFNPHADDGEIHTHVLWEPLEPKEFPGAQEIRTALRSALVEAGDDLTRGCSSVGVLLSGGIDSRVVLSVVPQSRMSGALTYVTNENRESRVAGEVAQRYGVEQILVRRGVDYFPTLVSRGLDLIGMELRANCHGLCVHDNSLADNFDAIIGGQLSDTLLKDHFMSPTRRHALRPKSVRSRVRSLLKGSEMYTPSTNHTTGRAPLENELTEDIRDQVRERKMKRMEEVLRVRPTTADEWHRFWPCSRQDDSAHTLGNTRLMCSDTLFAHQAVVEVSCAYAPKLRADGRVTSSVFNDLCGALALIENANTGLPANSSARAVRRRRKQLRRERTIAPVNEDWNDVETSWVDSVVMQKKSPHWVQLRRELSTSLGAEMLSKVVSRGGPQLLREYQDDLPSTSNHIAIQLAIWLERVLAHAENPAQEGIV